jgi:hypothetical protein
MTGSSRVATAVLAVVLGAGSVASALTKKELGCQAAIAKAGQVFVDAELANRGKCKMQAAQGKSCNASAKTAKNESKLRRVLNKCAGVALSNLGSGGCAASASDRSALGDCLVSGHEAAVVTLLTDQFGLATSETEVVLTGTMTQTSSLLPPANLMRFRAVSTAPVAITDLTLFCVTFAEPTTSASAGLEANGSFTLSIAAVGVPFGCFVVDDATGEQVATLVFRSSGGDATQVQAGNGTLSLGTVTLDLGSGEAVVDASSLAEPTTCDDGVTNPVDFTGAWNLACTPGPPGSGYGCASPGGNGGGPQAVYLHRVPGTDGSGNPVYWLGMWDSVDGYKACGQVEGLATDAGGTTTAGGETLGVPDGPFTFADDSTVFTAVDSVTSPRPGPPPGQGPGGPPPGGPQPMGICNSTAAHCSTVQNNDGNACGTPQPGQPPTCWGRPDFGTQPPSFVPFSDAQCRAMCYTMNLYGFGGPGGPPWIRQAIVDSGLCVQAGMNDMSVPPDNPNAIRKLGVPLGRRLLAKLNYSCDDAASVVHKFNTFTIGLPPQPGDQPGPPKVCHVTQRAEITLKMESPSKVIGDFKQTATLAPGDPAACTDDSNPQNPVANMLKNPMRMLFTLSR